MIGNYGSLSMTCTELFGHDSVPPDQASACLQSMLERRELTIFLLDAMANAMEEPDQIAAIFGPFLNQACFRLKGRNLVDQKLEAGKRKTFQPNDDRIDPVDPSLKLVRSASASLAKLTGQPRAVARAALDALNEDADQACRLLLSGLALALLDNCEVEELKPGIFAYLAADGEEKRPKVLSEGAFAGCFLLRTDKNRKEPLRLFALEPVDVCLLSRPSDEHPEGWAELEYTEAPEVEGFEKDGRLQRFFHVGVHLRGMQDEARALAMSADAKALETFSKRTMGDLTIQDSGNMYTLYAHDDSVKDGLTPFRRLKGRDSQIAFPP
ncbi:unnamed protein product [Durusdinium trenchii]|uniref:Uncharacterized protein n=1 Tax=Durusdinium trenchii TaxID=1381693 RepID=A0ABP0HAX8_9DINO